jgi:hypothetical protein
LRRSPIYMWIEAVVNWTYVPPNVTLPTLPPNVTLWMAGFKPHRIGNVGVALENDAGVVAWAARGSAYGTTGKLYTLALGDTERSTGSRRASTSEPGASSWWRGSSLERLSPASGWTTGSR